MENPVSGPGVPLSLEELRQSVLAVYQGNPHFTAAEQHQAADAARASTDAAHLAQWLRAARLDDARRGALARALYEPVLDHAVCLRPAAQEAEINALLACRALRFAQQWYLFRMAGDTDWPATDRLRLLGDSYRHLLDNLRRPEPRRQGFSALFRN